MKKYFDKPHIKISDGSYIARVIGTQHDYENVINAGIFTNRLNEKDGRPLDPVAEDSEKNAISYKEEIKKINKKIQKPAIFKII